MQKLIQHIFPPDPPVTPMTFTRLPVVHRYWVGGLIAALFGFALGFVLWAWQQGVLPALPTYPHFKLWHARIQILFFLGSFVLGFALQSGPHVVGGPPPPSRPLLRLTLLLQAGFVLSLLAQEWQRHLGNLMISLSYLGAVYYLARLAIQGDPLRRLARGIPLALSFIPLAIAPWLALDSADLALWVLWCGPITSALVAGQQLINNVLGGTLLQGTLARLFAFALLVAWSLSTVAAFTVGGSWQRAGMAWLVVLILLALGTGLLRVVRQAGFVAINVTLVLGFASAFLAAAWLASPGGSFTPDAAVHLLGAGMLTTLILGVATRVIRFFVGVTAFNDRLLCYLLLLWNAVVLARVATALGGSISHLVLLLLMGSGGLILVLWSFRLAPGLWQVQKNIPPALSGKKTG
ncbi:MAG: NnrS family protein [Magnetococcales bacterium]|nr:NnrS family protein [Magnetococcales bacterium]